jgi:hypothetical protein
MVQIAVLLPGGFNRRFEHTKKRRVGGQGEPGAHRNRAPEQGQEKGTVATSGFLVHKYNLGKFLVVGVGVRLE